jgi:hypothetical protein
MNLKNKNSNFENEINILKDKILILNDTAIDDDKEKDDTEGSQQRQQQHQQQEQHIRSLESALTRYLFFFTYALLVVIYVSHVEDRSFNTPRL